MRTGQSGPETCEGTLKRRAFLRAGLTGLSTLTLSDLLRLRGTAGPAETSDGPSIIVVWLWGGPATWRRSTPSPMPRRSTAASSAPSRPTCPGIRITEKLPRLAGMADKYCLIRSCGHDSPGHVNGTHTVMTGYPGELIETPPYRAEDTPTSSPSRTPYWPPPRRDAAVRRPAPAALHRRRAPGPGARPVLRRGRPERPEASPVPNISQDEARRARLEGRSALLAAFDGMRTDVDRSGVMDRWTSSSAGR